MFQLDHEFPLLGTKLGAKRLRGEPGAKLAAAGAFQGLNRCLLMSLGQRAQADTDNKTTKMMGGWGGH